MIGYALTGSFCTISQSIEAAQGLIDKGYDILPIMSEWAYSTNTRFGEAEYIARKFSNICGRDIIHTIVDAEPLGPKIGLEAMIISPCTGNTLAKLANGITDSAVCMAAKAHLRNNKPLIIALATNDALSANLKNIGMLFSRKNVYFVPLGQDDPVSKSASLVCDFSKIESTLNYALLGVQIQPLLL